MEPFGLNRLRGVPVFELADWQEKDPALTAGITAGEHYSLHRPQDNPADVVPNRRRLAEALGFSLDAWTSGEQVHGKRVARVTRRQRGAGNVTRKSAIAETDGLITNENDILLTAFYADCVPLLYWDPVRGVIGIAHAGWRGTTAGIANEMLVAMERAFGSDPRDIYVAVAPSIGPCCYEVDDRVVHALYGQLPSPAEGTIEPTSPGHYMLDLKRANREILLRSGIREEHLSISGYCTCCEEKWFFSHRRDAGEAGRMAAWIGRRGMLE